MSFKKVLKYITYPIATIFILGIIIFHHQISFNSHKVSFLGKEYNLSQNFPQFYKKYISNSKNKPNYVRNAKVFQKYQNYCHQNKKNCIIFPHQQTYSDIIWISSIQYIGSTISVSQTPYLYNLLDNLTNLSPYWDYPYFFGSLILPISKNKNSIPQKTKEKFRTQSVQIGEK